MPAANPDLIVWIDTETTGLDPTTDDLLEIAVVVTRNDLTEIGAFDIVITPNSAVDASIQRMDAFVREMHTANGLIDAMRGTDAHDPRVADHLVAGAIDRFTAGHPGPFLLGGNSITHDRGFLARHAPQTFSRLHYRSIDVSGIEQELIRDGYDRQIAAWRERFDPSDAHRALGDIRDSIRQLEALRSIRRARSLVA
ncbi:oligoribonuclease [Brachybacterium vulturis]|uniref:oligoribonuclease n=1 Tax=Brachybacterium vulturis TaxID=2017484 RepID=UPI003736059D